MFQVGCSQGRVKYRVCDHPGSVLDPPDVRPDSDSDDGPWDNPEKQGKGIEATEQDAVVTDGWHCAWMSLQHADKPQGICGWAAEEAAWAAASWEGAFIMDGWDGARLSVQHADESQGVLGVAAQ